MRKIASSASQIIHGDDVQWGHLTILPGWLAGRICSWVCVYGVFFHVVKRRRGLCSTREQREKSSRGCSYMRASVQQQPLCEMKAQNTISLPTFFIFFLFAKKHKHFSLAFIYFYFYKKFFELKRKISCDMYSVVKRLVWLIYLTFHMCCAILVPTKHCFCMGRDDNKLN